MVRLKNSDRENSNGIYKPERIPRNIIKFTRYGFIKRVLLSAFSFLCMNAISLVIPFLFPIWFILSIMIAIKSLTTKGCFDCIYCGKLVLMHSGDCHMCTKCKTKYEIYSKKHNTIIPI